MNFPVFVDRVTDHRKPRYRMVGVFRSLLQLRLLSFAQALVVATIAPLLQLFGGLHQLDRVLALFLQRGSRRIPADIPLFRRLLHRRDKGLGLHKPDMEVRIRQRVVGKTERRCLMRPGEDGNRQHRRRAPRQQGPENGFRHVTLLFHLISAAGLSRPA
jgi:hypothetical protein